MENQATARQAEGPAPSDALNPTEDDARRADPAFERAMNAYWRCYHTESREPWRCVQAVLNELAWQPANRGRRP